jgi:hypothetical protein
MTTSYSINNKTIIVLLAVICFLTPFAIGFNSNDDYSSIFDSSLFIENEDGSLLDSHFSGIIENNVSFVFCLAFTFFIQPEETFHQTLSIFSIFPNRASPLSLSR